MASSTASTDATLSYAPPRTEPLPCVAASYVKTTSSAVKGSPSDQVTPSLSFQVTVRPSALTSPFSGVGTSLARTGW